MKRVTIRIVFFLLLGAIINVAVAWGCALWIDAIAFEMSEGKIAIWYADGYAHAGSALQRSATLIIGYSRREMSHQEFNEYLTRTGTEVMLPMDQSSFPSGSLPSLIWQSRSQSLFKYGWDIANGWPFVALRYRMLLTEDDFMNLMPPVLNNGLKLSRSEEPITSSFLTGRALPLRPLWPGFAINTLFYAVIIWLLTFGPLTLRRLIRHKRGLCTKCAYDLRHADHRVCPECDTPT